MRRKAAGDFRRSVGLTLPLTLVEALDESLTNGENRSGRIESLVRDDLDRRCHEGDGANLAIAARE